MTLPPRLIFLPGAGADPGFWRPVGRRLPVEWRKAYLGWPGLGHQPHHPGMNGLEDLVALVETEIGEGPADLLAQSMGGLVAMMAVLRQGARVRRLVLSVTSAGAPMGRLGGSEWRKTYARNYPRAASWVGGVDVDLSAELSRIPQPVLLLWGDADPISPVAVGEHLRDLLPRARLHIVPGGDHDLVHDRADEIAPLIARHLGE